MPMPVNPHAPLWHQPAVRRLFPVRKINQAFCQPFSPELEGFFHRPPLSEALFFIPAWPLHTPVGCLETRHDRNCRRSNNTPRRRPALTCNPPAGRKRLCPAARVCRWLQAATRQALLELPAAGRGGLLGCRLLMTLRCRGSCGGASRISDDYAAAVGATPDAKDRFCFGHHLLRQKRYIDNEHQNQ